MVTTGHATVLLSGVQQGNSKKSGYDTEEQIYMHANIDFFFLLSARILHSCYNW